jgi:tight adherence protein B
MWLILSLVFLSAFAISMLLISAMRRPSSTLAHATLLAALRPHFAVGEEVIDISKEHRLSTIPWLNDLLSGINVVLGLRHTIVQAGMSTTPAKLLLSCALLWASLAAILNWRFQFGMVSPGIAFPAALLPFFYVLIKRSRRLNLMQQKLPEALDLMSSALRAGHSMGGALGTAARESPEPVGRELRICFEEINFGVDLRTALNNLLDRAPMQDLRMMATAMLIHKESGGNLAEVLEKAANVVRERARLRQEIRVHSAQGRLSGFILAVLPMLVALLLNYLNPTYIHTLFTEPLGVKIVSGAIVMNLLGLLIIHRIVSIRI